jgi:uncharacterized membrane protein
LIKTNFQGLGCALIAFTRKEKLKAFYKPQNTVVFGKSPKYAASSFVLISNAELKVEFEEKICRRKKTLKLFRAIFGLSLMLTAVSFFASSVKTD